MKKFKSFSKIVALLMVVTACIALFSGCGNSTASAQSSNAASNNQKKFNKDDVKKRYEEKLQALVKDNTITQDQSNKILGALTSNINNGRPGRKNNDANSNNANEAENATNKNNNGTGRTRNNPLSKLVEDKVITQDQADKVMNSIREGMGNRRNSNNTNGNGNISNQ